jgi:hypothetical protein
MMDALLGNKHNSSATLRRLLIRIAVLALAAYFVGPLLNRAAGWTKPGTAPAGFARGVVHGAMMPCTLPTLLIGRDLPIYERNNNGRLYNLGYTVGVNACGALFFGLLYWRLGRKNTGSPAPSVTMKPSAGRPFSPSRIFME